MASLQQQQQQQQQQQNPSSGASNLVQDPLTYGKLQEAFIKDLRHFHDVRGTSFKNNPKINGKEVDLYKLYTLVTSRGGWIQVNSKNEWAWLCEEFHLPSGCVNSGVGLKQIYLRYLDRYEKVHFLGEDGHHNDDDEDDSRHNSRHKINIRSLHSVPSSYNHNQHNVSDSLREYNGLSSDLYKPSNYDKLALSLLSPLPNEQDFAINVCTFLSNEGKHTLRLDKYPRLVNHLLAHAGIYDSPGTRQLFSECYSRVRNYSINSFWQDVLDAQDVLDLTDEKIFIKKKPQETNAKFPIKRRWNRDKKNKENEGSVECPMEIDDGAATCERLNSNGLEILEERFGGSTILNIDETTSSSTTSSTYKDQNQNSIKFEEDDKDLFCVGRTLGTQDPYGQRVLQIALILRNLSFFPENSVILGRSRSFLRFVLLCIRARWSNLHQLGFDILGNIANEIVLKEAGERLTGVILQCVTKGIDSPDRYIIISCLEILNKISQQDANEETLALGLDDNVYDIICRFLALSDIALLVYTLECLYALTSMGERPCNSVARVRGAIDTLVALVTVEAQSYGPKACILMRVVETVSAVPANQQQQEQTAVQPSPSQPNDTSNLPTWRRTSTVHHTGNASTVLNISSSNVAVTATNSILSSTNTSSVFASTSTPSPTLVTSTNSSTLQIQYKKSPQLVTFTSTSLNNKIVTTGQAQQQQPQLQQMQPAVSQPQVQVQQQHVTSTKSTTSTGNNSRPGTPKNTAAAAKAASTLQMQHTHQQIIQENEQFALGWLKANFELSPGIKIEQEELYKKYLGCCTKIGRRGVIAPLHFPRCVRSVFGGTIGPNPIKGETVGPMFYEGIKLRANPGPISYPGQNIETSTNQTATINNVLISGSSSSNNTNSTPKVQQQHNDNAPPPSSPILKAHLSAPAKPTLLVPKPGSSCPLSPTTSDFKSQVTVAHPHLSQALLNQQTSQSSNQSSSTGQIQLQTVQVIVKEDPRSATSSSIIKSLLATKVTVAGDSALSATTSSSTCVSSSPVAVTNATSVSANQLLTTSQVAQRQQQQRQQQLQQQTGISSTKIYPNSKPKQTILAVKKVQRLNGAKIIVTNNGEKADAMDVDSNTLTPSQQQTQLAIASITNPSSTEANHLSNTLRIIRPNQSQQHQIVLASTSPPNSSKSQRINISTPVGEDSDSTNNSLASSSGIGGSRDCSGVGAEEENSLTSFEGILLNGAPSNLDIDAQEDGSSKDSTSLSCKDKPLQGMMLADLLEKKADKEPIVNGVLGKKEPVENHVNKIKAEVSDEDTIDQPSKSLKRKTDSDSIDIPDKKPKYANGTFSPDPTGSDSTAVSSVKSEEPDDEKDEKVTVSSTAANLYAALAADIIDDEDEALEEPIKEEVKNEIKEEIKEEPQVPVVSMNQIVLNQGQIQQVQVQQSAQPQQATHQIAITQQQLQQLQQQQQQGLIMGSRQIVVQPNNQIVTIPAGALKGKLSGQTTQPQVLQVQQGQGNQQTHYVISGGVGGQNYVLAQPQTTLMQGQGQTVLVAQQQGSNAKTIIILQPQSASQQQPQKVLAVTPQGQPVVVTQVPRPILQNSAISSVPPPLVSTSAVNQTTIVGSNVAAQQTQTQTTTSAQLTQQTAVASSSVPLRVVTPTPTSTPPPTRPATPQQVVGATSKSQPIIVTSTLSAKDSKEVTKKMTDAENCNTAGNKPTLSSESEATTSRSRPQTPNSATMKSNETASTPKTITIKIDPNLFLCEWRGCLKQFKTPHKVFMHVTEEHCPTETEESLCLWSNCDSLKRRRFSLMAHLADRHCSEETMIMRRKQLTMSGKTEVTTTSAVPTTQHPGYAPNAALHAIKRHALEFVNPKELMQRPSKPAAATTSSSSPRPGQNPPPEQDDNEGPVTKSIRLTAALILRNLVIYSAHGRRHLRAYEPHLAGVALSNVESSRTIAQVLYDMNDQTSSGHR